MGIGIWELVLLLLIVLVLFGTKKLGTIGADLGSAIKGFRKAISDDDAGAKATTTGENPADKAPAESTGTAPKSE